MISSVDRGVAETPEETLRDSRRISPGRKSGNRRLSSPIARSTARILGPRVVPMAMRLSPTVIENEREALLDQAIGKDRPARGAHRLLHSGPLALGDGDHHAAAAPGSADFR